MLIRYKSARVLLPALATVALAWGCSEMDLTGLDNFGDPIQFSHEITLGELEDALSGEMARLEIQLLSEGTVARRVLVMPEGMEEAEEIKDRITAINVTGGEFPTGTLTLAMGGLVIGFDIESRFAAKGSDGLTFGQFVERVEAALDDGLEPPVMLERHPPDAPQAPDVSEFFAIELTLLDGLEEPEIEINVDVDNLNLNADRQEGEPDGWINVLGLSIDLRVSDGITELATKDADVSDAVEFEGCVQAVNLDAGSFTFTDGTVVRIVDESLIFEADAEFPLISLEEVAAALAEGHKVVAWGGGLLETKEPKVIIGLELRFAIKSESQEENNKIEFEGYVTSVDLEGSFTLTNGTVIRVTEETVLKDHGDGESLMSLEAVAAALEAGEEVVAYGYGEVETAEPLTLVACEMRFVLVGSEPPIEDFEGFVATVDETEGFFTLTNGIVVHMTETTQIGQPEQGDWLDSLGAVVEALNAGHNVVAWGKGEVESVEPLTIIATKVTFVISD
jgi:hypothetical protein